jgi:hypothetical protein
MAKLIVDSVRPEETGVASGMNTVMRTIGGVSARRSAPRSFHNAIPGTTVLKAGVHRRVLDRCRGGRCRGRHCDLRDTVARSCSKSSTSRGASTSTAVVTMRG